ncbi:MAG TPA: ABC transporter permease [Propionibacteriaceae bacterium]|nr:ABC transporter permease [Propionibacteriaceae bacterium]
MSVADLAPAVAGPVRTRRGPGLWRFYRSELRLIMSRRRNEFGLLVLVAVPILISIAVKYSSPHHQDSGGGPDFVSQILGNGIFVPLAALTLEMPMFFPLAMAILSGDSIAGEAHGGTLRYLVTVPAGRTRLLIVKLLALMTSAVVATLAVSVVGLVIGSAIFGAGPVLTLSGVTIGFGEGLWRVFLAALYVAAGLMALGAVGLFVSTLTEQPIAVTVIMMLTTMSMWILDQLSQLDWLHPWLLVDRWAGFSDLLRQPPSWHTMQLGLLVDAAYFAVFALLAWARFSNADITS